MIPGQLIALLTFPGVIVHEVAHQFFCRLYRVSVLDVCYFRYGNPAGYVIHEPPSKDYHQILIGVGPFLVNSLLGAIIAFPAAIPVIKFSSGTPLDYLIIWVGVSIAMHSFPSTGDADSMLTVLSSKTISPLTRALVKPIVWLIKLGAMGSVIWLDLVYGIALAMAFPALLIWLLK